MITEIRSKDRKRLFALLLRVFDAREGTSPASKALWPLQALLMKRPRGHIVRKHLHKKIRKSYSQPMEALVVIRGAVEVRIFDKKGAFVAKKQVAPGECLLIVDGAHEVVFKKDTLAYEFRTGPYKQEEKRFL